VVPSDYTPPHLARRILDARRLVEGERRQVTILFSDLKSSTELVSSLDPEEASRLLDPVLTEMMAAVHRFEGTVNRVQGDGLMAMFGAPLAHEDHALRACHAALEMQRAVARRDAGAGPTLALRVGIHSGEVVVRAIHNDLTMSYDAVGLNAHLAARVEQIAAPGEIRMTANTMRLVDGYVHADSLGPTALKGAPDAVEVYALRETTGARTRLEAAEPRGLTPFVGRGRELDTLEACFRGACEGHGAIVMVVGEPGIGKSRLLHELRQRIGQEATWLEGRAMTFGQTMPYYPLVDLLRRNFRIEEDDGETVIIEKIEAGVLHLDPGLAPILPYIRYLLAVDPGDANVAEMDPRLRQAELFYSLRRLLIRAAESRPQVIVFEDLHWIDSATESMLAFIADSVPTNRILCLFTYRPGYSPPFGDRTFHTRISLSSLPEEDTAAMVSQLLRGEGLPPELDRLIVEKAEGNPFFVEEVVRSLVESGAIRHDGEQFVLVRPPDEIVVPDTIQDVIMARIDRLEEAPRRTLQLASVIGREFTQRLLDRISDIRESGTPHLQALRSIELIYEKSHHPELAFMFKHALTQDVAYNSLLVAQRRTLHGLIGRSIEELYADRLADHYEVLAYHYERAEDWGRALEWLQLAAKKSVGRFATREALALYDRALDSARRLGDAANIETLIGLHRARAGLLFVQNDFEPAAQADQDAADLAAQCAEAELEGAALAHKALVYIQGMHDFDRSVEHAERALDIGERIASPLVVSNALLPRALTRVLLSRLDEGRADIARAVREAERAADWGTLAFSLCLKGITRTWSGEFSEALPLQRRGLEIAREHGMLLPLFQGLWMNGLTLCGLGRYGEARASLQEQIDVAERVGDTIWSNRSLNTLGWLYQECGDHTRARLYNERGAARSREDGFEEPIANAELNLADIALAEGDLPAAHDWLEGVYRITGNPKTSEWMKWRYSMHLFASYGEHALARGDIARAASFSNQSLEIAERTSSRKYLARGWRLAGGVALAKGQFDDAEAALRRSLEAGLIVGNPTQIWRTRLALADLLTECGRGDESRIEYRAARDVLDGMVRAANDPDLRESLETSPVFDRLRGMAVDP
jgi:class 3 adenylate cyclase/tetratricopeptide (TPR) repeat protein